MAERSALKSALKSAQKAGGKSRAKKSKSSRKHASQDGAVSKRADTTTAPVSASKGEKKAAKDGKRDSKSGKKKAERKSADKGRELNSPETTVATKDSRDQGTVKNAQVAAKLAGAQQPPTQTSPVAARRTTKKTQPKPLQPLFTERSGRVFTACFCVADSQPRSRLHLAISSTQQAKKS